MIPADTATLLQAAQAGDQAAAQRLVEANQGLVWSVVRRYLPSGQDREDLYQLGCLGLLKAIQGLTWPSAPSSPPTPCPRSPGRSGASSGTTAW